MREVLICLAIPFAILALVIIGYAVDSILTRLGWIKPREERYRDIPDIKEDSPKQQSEPQPAPFHAVCMLCRADLEWNGYSWDECKWCAQGY